MPYQLDPSSFDRAPSNLPGTATVNVQEQSIQIPQYVFWAASRLRLSAEIRRLSSGALSFLKSFLYII